MRINISVLLRAPDRDKLHLDRDATLANVHKTNQRYIAQHDEKLEYY